MSAVPHDYGLAIFDQHAELLAASGIPPEVAKERGYVSVDTKGQLDAAGFSKAQKVTPGLLIPVHCPDGEVRLHQYRPDNPRLDSKGRPRKYETPYKATMRIDCPPRCRPQVADPSVPLWITEGVRKADAAAAAGLCCLALLGVDNWRGTNDAGGKAALADWHDVALNGRTVYVAYDSDVMVKAEVKRALTALTGFLRSKGATVKHVYLPHGDDGAKVGLDDYLAAGHSVDELHALARDPAETAVQHELPPAGPDAPARRKPEMLPSPSDPMAVARHLLPAWTVDGCHTVRHWRGGWMRWQRTRWAEVEEKEIRAELYTRLENAVYVNADDEVVPWAPTKRKIADLLEATAAILHLPSAVDAPTWTGEPPTIAHGPLVACTNGLLDVATRELLDHDPRYFNLVSVPFDYNRGAPEPKRWLDFLADLWPDDAEQIDVLQEFFGYVLSGRTDLHKILLIVGPTRSGKGTIARVLTAMIGKANMAGPTLASMASNFGLSPLLGKPLAVISDARMAGRDTQHVVERLLTISGEDTIDVDRKYRDPWTGKLPTRFLILSNELPNFGDASGTIAHRFIVLSMTVSWLGKENTRLTDELTSELPGILNWALTGLGRLAERGRFTEPATSVEAVVAMKDAASPTSAFVREKCTVGPGLEVEADTLYAAWKTWCEDNGRDRAGTKQMLGRNLRSVVPILRVVRPYNNDGTRAPRQYQGITLGETNNRTDRGPSRSTSDADRIDRDRPRSNPLLVQHGNRACVACGQPLLLVAEGRDTCERCRLAGAA